MGDLLVGRRRMFTLMLSGGAVLRRWHGLAAPYEGGYCFIAAPRACPALQGARIHAKIKFDCWSKDFYQAL